MANFIVNQTTDDGTGSTTGTLSYAILQANQLAGDDTISIDTDVRVTGVMKTLVNSNITIVGNGNSISGDANNNGINDNGDVRPLFILSGTVSISDLTITNGRAKGGDSDQGGGGAGLGGGLFLYDGSVSLSNVAFSNNAAQGGNSGAGGFGGGGMFGNGDSDGGGAGGGGGLFGDGSGNYGGYGGNGNYGGGIGAFGGGGNGGYYGGGAGGFGGGGGAADFFDSNGGAGGFGGGGGSGGGNGGYGGGGGINSGSGGGGFGGGGETSAETGGGAGLGGGIFVRSGSLTLNNTSFTDNTATGSGGFDDNSQGLGGAIFIMQSLTNTNGNNQGMPTVLATVTAVNNLTFSGNSAADDAGTPSNNDDTYGISFVTNSPPTANNDTASVTEGQSVVISVLANDTDPDTGNILSLNSFTNPSQGTVTQNADGTFSYLANLDFFGADSFTYNIKDNSGAISNIATVNLTINPLNLEGGSGNDTLTGTATPNILNGNAGNDYIEGRAENDSINGGLGFNDRMFGGADNDTITDPDGILGAHGGTGNDAITITFAAAWDNDTNPSNAPRSDGKITGGYGDDNITVTMNKSNFFLNLKGDEPVSNTPQDGNDIVSLFGSYGNAVIDLGGGNDTFNGGAGCDNISGGNGSDLLLGQNGNDQLAGQNGNDTLRGGAGNDQLIGGAGNDVFVLAATEGKDTITDFIDTQDFLGLAGGLTFGQLSISASGSNTQIRFSSTNEVLAILTGINPSVINASDFITV